MKKIFLLNFLFLFFGFCSCAQDFEKNQIEKKQLIKAVSAINISSSFELYISQGTEESVTVSASTQEFVDNIVIKVENGELVIRYDKRNSFWKGWNTDRLKLKAFVSIKSLEKLTASGASEIYFEEGISGDNLSITLSGASSLKGKLIAKKLNANISGTSGMALQGVVSNLIVDASGASDFKGYNLVTDYCNTKTSGASSANINVNKELNATASGASSINYKGSGLIRDIRTSGASTISRKS